MSDSNKNVNIKLKIQAENKELKNLKKELTALKKQFSDVQKVGSEYANSTDGLNRKLSITRNQIEATNKLYETQKEKVKHCKQEIDRLENELKDLTAKYGENDPVVKNAIQNLEKQKDVLKRTTTEMQTTKNSVEMLSEAEKKLGQSLAISQYKDRTASLKAQGEALLQHGTKLQNLGQSADQLGSAMLRIGVPILGVGTAAAKMAIEYESAFAGVRKTTEATEAEYKKLSDSVIEMSTRLPKSASEIAGVMEMAGQLGVSKNDLKEFTEVMIKLGDTTNLSANDAAVALARFTNVAHTSRKDIGRLGSVIVELGNNTATTEAEIVSMASRIVGTGYQVGMTEPQIMALSATLSSLGIEAEAGGSAMSKLMSIMQLAVAEGGTKLEQFAKVSNMSAEQFKQAFKENASGAITSFVKGLDNIKQNGGDVISTLNDMDLSEVRLRDTILKLASGSDQLTNNINLSNKAWRENTALTNESNKRYETTEAKLQILKNRFNEQAIALGNELLPVATDFMEMLNKLLKAFNNLDPGLKKAIINFGLITTVMGGTLKVISPLAQGLGGILKLLGNMKLAKFAKGLGEVATVGTAAAGTVTQVGASTAAAGTTLAGFGGTIASCLPIIGGLIAIGGTAYVGIKMVQGATENANSTILTTRENMSFWGKLMADLSGKTIYTSEQLQDMGIKFKGVKGASEEFNNQLKNTIFDVQEFGAKLNGIKFDGLLDENEATEIVGRVDNLLKSIQEKIEGSNAKKNILKEMFIGDGNLSETEKAVLESMDTIGNKQMEKAAEIQEQIHTRIKEIKEKHNGEFTEQDRAFLEAKYKELSELEISLSANTQEELRGLKESWNKELQNMDIEQASQYITTQKDTTEKTIAEIRSRYDEAIQIIKNTLPNVDAEHRKALEQELHTLEEGKEKAIGKEREKYQSFIDVIREKYPQIASEIDMYSGQIMNDQEKKTQQMLDMYSINYIGGIQTKTQEGFQVIQTDTDGALSAIYSIYDQKTGEIIGVYNVMGDHIITNNNEIKQSFEAKRDKLTECTAEERERMRELQVEFHTGKININQYNEEMRSTMERFRQKVLETKEVGDLFSQATFRANVDVDQALSELRAANNELQAWLANSSSASDRHIAAQWGTPRGYSMAYYTGTTFAKEGIAEINEHGWELFADRNYREIFSPFVHAKTAFLPEGARVTNHLNSVAMMREDITKEVRRQIANINFSSPYFSRYSPESRTFINNVNNSTVSTTQGVSTADIINAIVAAIELGFKKVKFEPNIEVNAEKEKYDLGYELAMMNLRKG